MIRIYKRGQGSSVFVLLSMLFLAMALLGCVMTETLKYVPSNDFPNLGKGNIRVQVGDFENKLGLRHPAMIRHEGLNEYYVDRAVSMVVRDALFAELKNANFLVGRGDIVISGEIYALGMPPSPNNPNVFTMQPAPSNPNVLTMQKSPDNLKYDRTTITFRVRSLAHDKLLFEQTYSSSVSAYGKLDWLEITALSLQECIVGFLNDLQDRNVLRADGFSGKPVTASLATVQSGTPGTNGRLFVEAEPKGSKVRILNIKPKFSQGILLKPGRYLVEVSAPGYNTRKDWVELAAGQDKTVRIRLAGEQAVPAGEIPRIWLFSMGVSGFKDEGLNLEYAAIDAKNFYKFFRSASGAMLPKTQAVLLMDEAASRGNVIRSLVRMVKKANEKDLIVIFFATHGLPDPDTGEINFIMHDTALDNLVGSGLSHSDLDRIIQRSKAGKVLFVVDACHSGGLGAGTLLARRGIQTSEVNRLISELAEATDGTAVLSASSSNEMSMEGERWEGGVFTYYMIGGLRGRADADQDQIVTLRELFDYVYKKVPAATDGQQHPELKGQFSNDLPLVEVNP